MRAVIIDDEPLARAHLRKLLTAHQVEVIAEGSSGVEALSFSEELRPDALFLDIEMPGLTGMQVVAAINSLDRHPFVIFVTGYSEHAPQAFEHAALDYLLKPVTPERLVLTLTRVRAMKESRRLANPVEDERLTPAQRLPVRTDYAIKLVRVEEIQCAVAKDKKVTLSTTSGKHKTYYSLNQLEKLLPEGEFMRIHASVIARLSAVEELHFLGNHSYSVKLSDGLTLPVGRTQFAELQRRLGLAR